MNMLYRSLSCVMNVLFHSTSNSVRHDVNAARQAQRNSLIQLAESHDIALRPLLKDKAMFYKSFVSASVKQNCLFCSLFIFSRRRSVCKTQCFVMQYELNLDDCLLRNGFSFSQGTHYITIHTLKRSASCEVPT